MTPPGPIASLIATLDDWITERRALASADLDQKLDHLADRIVNRLSRKIRQSEGAIMADLSALEAQVTAVSDNATELSGVVDEVLAKIAELGVQDAELDAMTERLRAASTSLDEDTTQLATAVAPVEEPPA